MCAAEHRQSCTARSASRSDTRGDSRSNTRGGWCREHEDEALEARSACDDRVPAGVLHTEHRRVRVSVRRTRHRRLRGDRAAWRCCGQASATTMTTGRHNFRNFFGGNPRSSNSTESDAGRAAATAVVGGGQWQILAATQAAGVIRCHLWHGAARSGAGCTWCGS